MDPSPCEQQDFLRLTGSTVQGRRVQGRPKMRRVFCKPAEVDCYMGKGTTPTVFHSVPILEFFGLNLFLFFRHVFQLFLGLEKAVYIDAYVTYHSGQWDVTFRSFATLFWSPKTKAEVAALDIQIEMNCPSVQKAEVWHVSEGGQLIQ